MMIKKCFLNNGNVLGKIAYDEVSNAGFTAM
jgi:hypothetical protein